MSEVDYKMILAESVFQTTQVLCDFYEKEMKPQFNVILNPTPKENAMFNAYQKMYLYLLSLSKLDHKLYFQTVLNVVRSMFELSLDIVCINNDETGFEAEKYFAYPDIARYKMAKKVMEYIDKHPDSNIGGFFSDSFISGMKKFAKEMEKGNKIETLKNQYWAGTSGYPLYWSGKSCEKFAVDLDMTERYLRVYPLYSWFVHSGPSGFMSFNEKTVEILFYFAHCEAHGIFLNSTRIIAEHFHFSKTIPDFQEALKNLEALPQRFAIEEGLRKIAEK